MLNGSRVLHLKPRLHDTTCC